MNRRASCARAPPLSKPHCATPWTRPHATPPSNSRSNHGSRNCASRLRISAKSPSAATPKLLQGQEAVARLAGAESQRAGSLASIEADCAAQSQRAHATDARSQDALNRSQELGQAAREAQARLADLRRAYQELKQTSETMRESLSAARARRASLSTNSRRPRLLRRCGAEALRHKWLERRKRFPRGRLARRLRRSRRAIRKRHRAIPSR